MRFPSTLFLGITVLVTIQPQLWLEEYQPFADALQLQPTLDSVANFRPVCSSTSSLYRSATLDQICETDAQRLIDRSSTKILDLRNPDEIAKGQRKRTEGSLLLYDALSSPNQPHCSLHEIPILQNVDAFWDAAIDRMPVMERTKATLQTVVSAGALDRAAARHLEQGGCSALYTVMLETAGNEFYRALTLCHQHIVTNQKEEKEDSLLLFHCQKGKDRTGVLGMLLQHCMGDSPEEIVKSYAVSGDLLGETTQGSHNQEPASSSGLVDWSHFRGSPKQAMVETLAWIQETYGSVDGYLDSIGFSAGYRQDLQAWQKQQRQQQPPS